MECALLEIFFKFGLYRKVIAAATESPSNVLDLILLGKCIFALACTCCLFVLSINMLDSLGQKRKQYLRRRIVIEKAEVWYF